MGWFGRKREEEEQAAFRARVEEARRELDDAETLFEWARLEDWADHVDGVVLAPGERAHLVGQGALAAEPMPGASRLTSYSRDPALLPSIIESVTVGRITPGEEEFQVVAKGTLVITDRRVLFLGDRRTFEWTHGEVVGLTFGDEGCIVHLTGREKPIAIGYGQRASVPAEGVLTALVARAQGTEAHAALLRRLEQQVDAAEGVLATLADQAG